MAAWFPHDGRAQPVVVGLGVAAFVQDVIAGQIGPAAGEDAQRFAGGVGVYGCELQPVFWLQPGFGRVPVHIGILWYAITLLHYDNITFIQGRLHMFDYVVIGKGLIGSAAARYLSMRGRTAVIGPDEPPDLQTHEGVFASHYDQGRITRQLSRDAVWAALARMSIGQYAALGAESGIRFHYPVGGLYVPAAAEASSYLAEMAGLAERVAVDYEVMDEAALHGRWPYLRFSDGWSGLYEAAPAGYINPRQLIRAQLAAGQKQGLEIVRETAVSLESSLDYLTITTDAGQSYRTKKVLVAAGAFSNAFDLLLQKLKVRVKTETIILAETPPDAAERWAEMPPVIYYIESPELDSIYLLPPIRYPDGRIYLKMGCNTVADRYLSDLTEIGEWFRQGQSDVMLEAMRAALQGIMPDLAALSWQTGRCVVTYTTHGRPYIGLVGDGRIGVAVGGNGSGAKSSDGIGRLGAAVLADDRWATDLAEDLFRPVFEA